jgi:hypothetical protein
MKSVVLTSMPLWFQKAFAFLNVLVANEHTKFDEFFKKIQVVRNGQSLAERVNKLRRQLCLIETDLKSK